MMTMSSGQVGLLPQKVTSARCTQSEPGWRKNRRVSTGIVHVVMVDNKHTRTKELQDMISTLASCI